MKKNHKRLLWALAVLIVLIVLFFVAASFSADYLEAVEIGYESVYLKNLQTQYTTWAVSFGVIFLVFAINLYVHMRIAAKTPRCTPIFKSFKAVTFIAAVAALLTASIASEEIYPLYLKFYSSVPFNQTDPIFNQDIGYYIFQRPFMSAVSKNVKGLLFFQVIYTIVLYIITYLRTDIYSFKEVLREKSIITHVITNVVIFFLSDAVAFKFTAENILYGKFGELSGAGFTDVTVWLNYFKVAPFLLLAVVVLTIIFLLRAKIRGAFISILSVPALWLIALITAGVVQIAFVKPYEVSMERQYINYNIDATRYGFSLNNIEEREFPADNDLTYEDIQNNKSTIDNIRITDLKETLTATNSLQGLRSFYTFPESDITCIDIDGKKTAVTTAVREFDADKLPDSAKSYINRRLRYTHGYGIVMSPVNKVTQEGQPQFVVKDIPINSASGAPQISQERIYFGELTNDYVIVGSTYNELDYMEGDKTVEYSYSGSAGIPLNFWTRAVFAVKEADPMMIMSGYITPESRLLTNRNILERVKNAVPFLTYDTDPYIVIDGQGRLKWVIDAYTTTDIYPYSQEYRGINYIRNSAKVVVDAYNGTVEFYIIDSEDPIIKVYSRMYPGVFKEEPLPYDIAPQIRYPEQIFKLQSEVYKMYHVSEAEALYSKSDIWVEAKEKHNSGETVDVAPYYNLMKLDISDSSEEELVLMQPYTPQGKENLVSWIAARSDPDNYGKLIVYRFPKGKTVYGTLHIENKIDNDPNISKEISLWDQGGSTVIKGNLLVVPVENSLLFVEPIYITAKNSAALPEIKRIVVVFDEKVAMEPTIGAALEVIFGNKPPTVYVEGEEKTVEDLISEAIAKYAEMQVYSENSDFKNFGAALDEIGELLTEIEEKTLQVPQEETNQDSSETSEMR